MITLRRPRADAIARFIDAERALPFSYDAVGATRDERSPTGFDVDHNRQLLGHGVAVFAAARVQLAAWRMFPPAWTAIEPSTTPIVEGTALAVLVHALGVWFTSSARIVYVIEEPRRFGFAYGTLPAHAECGEERFLIEHASDDGVWYDLRAFSKPRLLAARMAYPVTRRLQKRFARESKMAMLRAVR
jgi:uncharacterized protein (UPF0548 family)